MKITWSRASIMPKIYHDSRTLTYTCATAKHLIKRCKEFTYFTCATSKAMEQVLTELELISRTEQNCAKH